LTYGNPDLNADQLGGQYLSLGPQLDTQVPNPFFGVITDPGSALSEETVAYNQLLPPYPQLTYLNWNRSLPGARSEFNALGLKFTHAFSSGFESDFDLSVVESARQRLGRFHRMATGNAWRDSYNTNLD
jgi:hypothetical protein